MNYTHQTQKVKPVTLRYDTSEATDVEQLLDKRPGYLYTLIKGEKEHCPIFANLTAEKNSIAAFDALACPNYLMGVPK